MDRIKYKRSVAEVPAMSQEARDNRCIALATDLAERQLLEGTASPSVIVHYLKLGTEKTRNENMKLQAEIELTRSKTKATESAAEEKQLYAEFLSAFREYKGIN